MGPLVEHGVFYLLSSLLCVRVALTRSPGGKLLEVRSRRHISAVTAALLSSRGSGPSEFSYSKKGEAPSEIGSGFVRLLFFRPDGDISKVRSPQFISGRKSFR